LFENKLVQSQLRLFFVAIMLRITTNTDHCSPSTAHSSSWCPECRQSSAESPPGYIDVESHWPDSEREAVSATYTGSEGGPVAATAVLAKRQRWSSPLHRWVL